MITPFLVKEVIDTKLDNSSIEGAISTALTLYRNYLGSRSLDSALAVEIKRYLAAHFVSILDPSVTVYEEEIGDASVKYGVVEKNAGSQGGVLSSRWGMTAVALDPTGILKSLGSIPPRLQSLAE